MVRAVVVDALGSGKGTRLLTRDAIGAGPRWICGVLESHGIECRIQTAEAFLRSPQMPSELLFVSAMSMDMPAVRRISRAVQKHRDVLKVLGGPIASNPHDALVRSGFDVAVYGEGERPLEAIIGGREFKHIPGVSFWEDSSVLTNPPERPLDEASYNRYMPSIERIADYPTFFAGRVYVEVVRGCSNFKRTSLTLSDGRRCTHCTPKCMLSACPEGIPPGCGYCSVPAVYGPPKSRSVDLVEREVRGLVEMGVKRIVLSAPDFLDYRRGGSGLDPCNPPARLEAVEELLSACREASNGRARLSVENVKPCLLDEGSAALLGRYLAGTDINIGCETGDEAHSEELGRPCGPTRAVEAVRAARRHGLRPHVYFVYGLPGQTLARARRTARLIESIAGWAEKVTVYRFKPIPASAFESEPAGAASRTDPGSRLIVKAARDVNFKKKRELVGREVEAIVAEENLTRRGELICFPLLDGPVMAVKGGRELVGREVKVRVLGVLSEGLVRGEVVEVAGD